MEEEEGGEEEEKAEGDDDDQVEALGDDVWTASRMRAVMKMPAYPERRIPEYPPDADSTARRVWPSSGVRALLDRARKTFAEED